MRTRPRVSVIITFRNGLPWILHAIDSVVAQSFTDWELVLIDDGSSDGSTGAIIAKFGKPPNFRILRSPPKGRGCALNQALEEAQGEWIANLDADDLFHPDKLKMQVEAASHTDKQSIVCTKSIVIGEQESVFWPDIMQPHDISDISRRMLRRNNVNHSSVLVCREFLKKIGGYDEKRRSQFDYELWLRVLHSGGRVQELLAPLTAKRIHAHQSFEAGPRFRYVWSSLLLQLHFARKLGAKPLDYLFFIGKFIFGFFPRNLRQVVWKYR